MIKEKEKLIINNDLTLYIGGKYKIYYGEGNYNNKTIHIIKFIDNEYVVYKTRFKRKKRWSYQIESVYYFELLNENNNLTLLKK